LTPTDDADLLKKAAQEAIDEFKKEFPNFVKRHF